MTKPPELKPCPFCGGALTVGKMNVARCKTDECVLEHFAVDLDLPEKVAAWNNRTPDPAVPALVEAAREVLWKVAPGHEWEIVALSNLRAALAAFDKTQAKTKGE